MPKHVNDILRNIVIDLFDRIEKSPEEKRAERIEARNRHMPKIYALLDMEYEPMRKDAA